MASLGDAELQPVWGRIGVLLETGGACRTVQPPRRTRFGPADVAVTGDWAAEERDCGLDLPSYRRVLEQSARRLLAAQEVLEQAKSVAVHG